MIKATDGMVHLTGRRDELKAEFMCIVQSMVDEKVCTKEDILEYAKFAASNKSEQKDMLKDLMAEALKQMLKEMKDEESEE